MSESHRIFFIKVGRNFYHNRLLFYFPKRIKDSIRNDHNIGFLWWRVFRWFIFINWMHVTKHLNCWRTSGNFQIWQNSWLLSKNIVDQILKEKFNLFFVSEKTSFLSIIVSFLYFGLTSFYKFLDSRSNSIISSDLFEKIISQWS